MLTSNTELNKSLHWLISHGQNSMWTTYELDPNNYTYNVPTVLTVNSQIDGSVLCDCWRYLINRHENLRSTFIKDELTGVVYQTISSSLTQLPFEFIDAGDWDDEKLLQEISLEARRKFDLEKGPLIRLTLYSRGDVDHYFMFNIHHIVIDLWSTGLLVKEFLSLYDALKSGSEIKNDLLPTLTNNFGDFIPLQDKLISGSRGQKSKKYWLNDLTGDLPVLDLPLDYPRKSILRSEGKTVRFYFDGEFRQRLFSLAQQNKVSLYTLMFALYHLFLRRYTNQTDINVGSLSMATGRTKPEFESVVGYLINTFILRINESEELSFYDFLQIVRKKIFQAMKNRDYPLTHLMDQLSYAKDSGHNPIFQSMFSWFNAPTDQESITRLFTLGIPGIKFNSNHLEVESYPVSQKLGQYDLSLLVADIGDRLVGEFCYNVDFFKDETAERMADHISNLIKAVVADPSKKISEYELRSDAERRTQNKWNKTDRDIGSKLTLNELFKDRVVRDGGNAALCYQGREISYKEFDNLTDRLALILRSKGVGPESLVGVCMERSVELVLSLYGIIKAGGAYVPVDPYYPEDRQRFILEDANIKILLVSQENEEEYRQKFTDQLVIGVSESDYSRPDTESSKQYSVNSERDAGYSEQDTGHSELNTENSKQNTEYSNLNTGKDTAYVIYTSGSTGRPKGVMVPHEAIVNRLLWMQGEYGLTKSDRVLQKTPYTFDVSVWEFFWPLISGATLVMAPPQDHKDPQAMIQLVRDNEITTIHFVPPMLRVFLEELKEPRLSQIRSLKRVICSGEELPFETKEEFFNKLPTSELHNLYGPTEAAVDVSYYKCVKGESGPVPIGRPVWNTQLYILDKQGNNCPIGVPGELHIGGIQLAKGYINRPELTVEKFYRVKNKKRLYRTGDLARFKADGNIEFLGRIDFQVKLRGFRIELGEIEGCIREQEAVADTVVVIKEDKQKEKQLVSYITEQRPLQVDETDLRQQLQKILPDYMVPSFIIKLKALPLNNNGKVDRKNLPNIEIKKPTRMIAPKSPLEIQLVEIWSEVLGTKNISLDANFFEIGGHSLLVAKLRSLILEELKVDIKVVDLFKYTTVSSLAEFISISKNKNVWKSNRTIVKRRAAINRKYKNVALTKRERVNYVNKHV